jgi:septum site-determining protein MinC
MAEEVATPLDATLKVRGTRDGIVFTLPAGAGTVELLAELAEAIEQRAEFLEDAEVVVDYGDRMPQPKELARIEELFKAQGVKVASVTASDPEARAALYQLGQRPLRLVRRAEREPARASQPEERQALYVRRTLRSGASVYSDGDLVIMGDVNAGAEVSAAGDVLVWGSLRGTVQAGAHGEESAQICALRLEPTQLRIGKLVARPADNQAFDADAPQRAYLSAGGIVVEPWHGSDRRSR